MLSPEYELSEDYVQYWWIIPLLTESQEHALVGRVESVSSKRCIIRCEIPGLPTSLGEPATLFLASHKALAEAGAVKKDDLVRFHWVNPGTAKRDRNGTAYAIAKNVRQITEDAFEERRKNLLDYLQAELIKRLHHELSKAEASIDEEVSSRTQSKLAEAEAKLEQAVKLKELAEQQLGQAVAKDIQLEQERRSLADTWRELEGKGKVLEAKANELAAEKAKLESLYENHIKHIEYLFPKEVKAGRTARASMNLVEIREQWVKAIESAGLRLPEDICLSFLVSTLTACLSGCLVLLSGPVGTGKTSTIRTAAQLLDGGDEVVPVRPGWLDSSDLLGFYDPLRNIYSPSPFVNGLIEAKNYSDRLFFLALDELNLARIEDYGADLLSVLEYSKGDGEGQRTDGLKLYAQDLQTRLRNELTLLCTEQAELQKEGRNLSVEKRLRLEELAGLLKTYPGTLGIPENLVLLGTLNADETTYDLSPKVIDRSYVIQFPPAQLEDYLNTIPRNLDDLRLPLSLADIQPALSDTPLAPEGEDYWTILLGWKDQLQDVVLPLGHRAKRDFRVFTNTAHLLGMDGKEAFRYFIFTKILPRIRFLKDDEGGKGEALLSWLNNREVRPYLSPSAQSVAAWLSAQVSDELRPLVSYWR
ncbi:MAG: hypothetical protein AA931_08745 [Peptococcaceae bacterium 1109]|nr:MAG: hypothetical protein AA931_08745 [Peptococcaceae bacterium 1109]